MLLLLACTGLEPMGPDNDSGVVTGPSDADTDVDADGDGDADGDSDTDSDADADAPCHITGFTAGDQGMAVYDDSNWAHYAAIEGAEPTNGLSLEFYPDYGGAFGSQSTRFDNSNYADCGTCLVAYEDCVGGSCVRAYLAVAGTVDVSQWGSSTGDFFAASLTDVELVEVTIDNTTWKSTIVSGGKKWCIPASELYAYMEFY